MDEQGGPGREGLRAAAASLPLGALESIFEDDGAAAERLLCGRATAEDREELEKAGVEEGGEGGGGGGTKDGSRTWGGGKGKDGGGEKERVEVIARGCACCAACKTADSRVLDGLLVHMEIDGEMGGCSEMQRLKGGGVVRVRN